jgi:hypothetical protein
MNPPLAQIGADRLTMGDRGLEDPESGSGLAWILAAECDHDITDG